MAVQGFGADFQFFLANDDVDEYIYGLVNLAAFLANGKRSHSFAYGFISYL